MKSRSASNAAKNRSQSGLEAKFSLQYCLARALNHAIRIEHFEGDAFRDPAIRAILPRVHAAAYTTTQFPADNHLGAEVKVTTLDGKIVSGKIDEAMDAPAAIRCRRTACAKNSRIALGARCRSRARRRLPR